jgi:lysozyme family protein
MPYDRHLAEQRAHKFKQDYMGFLNDWTYIKQGHAEMVPQDLLLWQDRCRWYVVGTCVVHVWYVVGTCHTMECTTQQRRDQSCFCLYSFVRELHKFLFSI